MKLPAKALIYSQLNFETEGSVVETSGNKVKKAHFITSEGVKQECFFKSITAKYNPFVAKNCVGISYFFRRVLGDDQASEEWLIFSNNGSEIVGTISLALPNFQPLKFATFSDLFQNVGAKLGFNAVPSNTSSKELLTNPDVRTLLEYNIAQILVAQWGFHQEDFHGAQVSLRGRPELPKDKQPAVVDYDMNVLDYIEGARTPREVHGVLVALPKDSLRLRACHLDNFPRRDINGPTHWPTHIIPGNLYATKAFASAHAFRELTKNPTLDTKSGEKIEFQEQLFCALLKQLLTYDQESIRAGLAEYLGDLPLDFKSLPEANRTMLLATEHAKTLYTNDTNDKPFADFMSEVAYLLYQELYQAVVFYPGINANDERVPVVSFKDFLHNKPSAYQRVMDWIREQNEQRKTSWEKYQTMQAKASTQTWETYFDELKQGKSPEKPVIPPKHSMPPEALFDTERVMDRYNGVWRDAHLSLLKAIMKDSADNIYNLAAALNIKMERKPSSLSQIGEVNVTSAAEFIGENKIAIPPSKTKDANIDALRKLIDFHNRLAEEINRYAALSLTKLTIPENQKMRQVISETISTFRPLITKALSPQTDWSKAFLNLVSKLGQFCSAFDIECHFAAGDKPLHRDVNQIYEKSLQVSHCEDQIITSNLQELFEWAKKEEENNVLYQQIETIIKENYNAYKVNVFADKVREEPVKLYLKQSKETGDNKLAWILSWGGTTSTSLNTLLIKKLIPRMIQNTPHQGEVHILSLKDALDSGSFDVAAYTIKAAELAKKEPFNHEYSDNFAMRFNQAMYTWINQYDPGKFKTMVQKAWSKYNPDTYLSLGKSLFYAPNRSKDKIFGLFNGAKPLSNAFILASILGESGGGYENTSYNVILFDMLLSQMKMDISGDAIKRADNRLNPILAIKTENRDHFISTLFKMSALGLKMQRVHEEALQTVVTC